MRLNFYKDFLMVLKKSVKDKKKRRVFTPEFKLKVVRSSYEWGVTCTAKYHNICRRLLQKWRSRKTYSNICDQKDGRGPKRGRPLKNKQ